MDLLAWVDLETSGTDELRDWILEIALVITDYDLNEVSRLVRQVRPPGGIRKARDLASDAVCRMHDKNGLWNECETAHSMVIVEAEVIDLLKTLGKKHDFTLAGSGVGHFDRRFIALHMPTFNSWLRYYCIDVGTVRRTLRLIGRGDLVAPDPDKPHRALGDVLLHIEELKYLRERLRQ